jgi:hypothetical protein
MACISPELLQSEKFVVLLEAEGRWRRLVNLRFERGRNGLGYQVDLPHFAHSRGVLRRFTLGGPPGSETRVDLEEGGTTTSYVLKYSHHADGRAHFSQDGRHVTQVASRTPRLRSYAGHLFTANYWGSDAFREASQRDRRHAPPRTCPLFVPTTGDGRPAADLSGRLVGEAYPLRGITISPAMRRNGNWSRPLAFRRGDGTVGQGLFALPPDPRPDDFLIVLSHVSMDRAGAEGGTSLVFSGGFDAPDGADGPLTAIAMSYQDRDEEDWARRVALIGSADYRPGLDAGGAVAIEGAGGAAE